MLIFPKNSHESVILTKILSDSPFFRDHFDGFIQKTKHSSSTLFCTGNSLALSDEVILAILEDITGRTQVSCATADTGSVT